MLEAGLAVSLQSSSFDKHIIFGSFHTHGVFYKYMCVETRGIFVSLDDSRYYLVRSSHKTFESISCGG